MLTCHGSGKFNTNIKFAMGICEQAKMIISEIGIFKNTYMNICILI